MTPKASPEIESLVRVAARALGSNGLAHAYGHCSQRLDEEHFLVCAPRPMGLLAPEEPGTVVPIAGTLPPGVLGEVSIHQQIYATRPDIGGVCRTMPPTVMALSVLGKTPRPRHGIGSYFSPEVPLWADVQLVRTPEQAKAVCETMGNSCALVMQGNGVITIGSDLRVATVLNWYIEDAARIEVQVLNSGCKGILLDEGQARQRAIRSGEIFERMWQYMTFGDPEINSITTAGIM